VSDGKGDDRRCLIAGVAAIGTRLRLQSQYLLSSDSLRLLLGILSIASPMYLAELAPPRMRGNWALLAIAIVVGRRGTSGFLSHRALFSPSPGSGMAMDVGTQLVLLRRSSISSTDFASPRWLPRRDASMRPSKCCGRCTNRSLRTRNSSKSKGRSPRKRRLARAAAAGHPLRVAHRLPLSVLQQLDGWSAMAAISRIWWKRRA